MSYFGGTLSIISFASLVTTTSRGSTSTAPASFGCTDIMVSSTICVVLLWYLRNANDQIVYRSAVAFNFELDVISVMSHVISAFGCKP